MPQPPQQRDRRQLAFADGDIASQQFEGITDFIVGDGGQRPVLAEPLWESRVSENPRYTASALPTR
ncbi:hypothetical protein GCM10023334_102640 [Nonomuraea thailandensis]